MATKIAVGYTRLSQKSDASIDDQKQEIRDLADEQGFNLTRIYDDGELASGFDSERPEYLQMQTELEDGLADVLCRSLSTIQYPSLRCRTSALTAPAYHVTDGRGHER